MDDLLKLLSNMELIFDYIIPGFIFFSIRNRHLSISSEDVKITLFKAITFSYILVSGLKLKLDKSNDWFSILLIAISILISIIYVKFDIEEKFLNKIIKTDKTANMDSFSDIFGSDTIWIYVYMPKDNIIYCGKLVYYENCKCNEDRNILISNYTITSYEGEKIEDNRKNDNACAILNTKNISRIQMKNNINISKRKKTYF